MNPGPPAPEARIIPLDHLADIIIRQYYLLFMLDQMYLYEDVLTHSDYSIQFYLIFSSLVLPPKSLNKALFKLITIHLVVLE